MADQKAVKELNKKIYENGGVDRAHILEFLELIKTNDARTIIREVQTWLESLHNDPDFSKVEFPDGDIQAIIGDLDSYGRVQAETIMEFKEKYPKTVNQ